VARRQLRAARRRTIAVVDPANGAVQRWDTYAPPGLDPAAFGKQSIIRWKA
jgi:hypothetical protein